MNGRYFEGEQYGPCTVCGVPDSPLVCEVVRPGTNLREFGCQAHAQQILLRHELAEQGTSARPASDSGSFAIAATRLDAAALARIRPNEDLDPGGFWAAGAPPLAPRALATGATNEVPGGPMAAFVGPRLSPDVLEDALQHAWDGLADEEDVEAVRTRGRVFPVTGLLGYTLRSSRLDQLGDALSSALASTLGGQWTDHLCLGAIEKYGILHTICPAPPDTTTGFPMALELYGRAVVGDWERAGQRRPTFGAVENLQAGPVTVVIESAHWSNYRHASVGVPFYM